MKNFLILVLALLGLHSAYAGVCTNQTILTDLGSTQLEFMTGLIQGTLNVIANDGSYLEPFFDGTTPEGSIDYVDNSTATDELVSGMVAYFAATAPFNCTDSNIPVYTNTKSLKEIHKNMPIDESAFNIFNAAMLGVLQGMGVSEDDQTAVLNLLTSTKSDICNECTSFGIALTPAVAMTFFAVLSLMF
eukprot:CAMPEP_0168556602 /NCGR_PEP_ID=MMETSP0413-20121227/8972_1 /TAXON_ID=136452 /ORGANISM="Filamoeba nolandi, Strain NC-AS-23-1" /LENGTH=188 /DNA_ID=CAMNT_0008587563 /DNA_START=35 /DNA_END=601 /DNA_ORIENTATION=+